MEFVVGCDLEEFKRYYKKLALDEEWQETFGFTAELGDEWERRLTENPSLLIVWREDGEIVGHAIWHESGTEEHRRGDVRNREDKEILERLVGGEREFVELHEVWLRKEYRRMGFGKRFFGFFEEFVRGRGYDSIVYYADHPAAIAICRRQGYKEEYWKEKGWHVFYLPLDISNSFNCHETTNT